MTDSVAIVTGASSGIGRATALRLARDFSRIVLVARGGDALANVAAQIRSAGREALVLEFDLRTPISASAAVEQTLRQFGRLDALFNIAGAVPAIDLFHMTDEHWNDGLALKFHGARRLTLAAWDALKSTRGAVVFISGTAADVPRAATAAISSINSAIEALAKAFADRGVSEGVQVNCVSPGAVMTGRRRYLIEKAASSKGVSVEQAAADFLQQAGINRFGTPEEIAELMAFLVSPGARWMTGSVVRMDGGEVRSV